MHDFCYTANERWYLARTEVWARALRAGMPAGVMHAPGADVDFAAAVLGLRPGMRILDLGCSWGRTTLELWRRGYQVSGFDLSPELLGMAAEKARHVAARIEYHQGTVRLLPKLGLFDAVCAFYDDSLISFEDEEDNLRALRRVAEALEPGGRLLFGTTDCPLLLPACHQANFVGDALVEERIAFDAQRMLATCDTVYQIPGVAPRQERRRRRHLRLDEVASLLADAGLELRAAFCAYDTALVYGCRPEGMVIVAAKQFGGPA